MIPATLVAATMDATTRRAPVLHRLSGGSSFVLTKIAAALGTGTEGIALTVGISPVTGILFKIPSGALSDVIDRRRIVLLPDAL